jgi:hypothetical protein
VANDMVRISEIVFSPRLLAVLAAINPILLLVVGIVLNRGIDSAKLKIEQNQAQIQDLKTAAETSSIHARIQVDKVKVIQDFLTELSGTNETRRLIAIEAILIVLPEEAPRLVKVIERNAGGANTKDAAAAKTALEQTRSRLVTDMFSEDRSRRVDALHGLQRGWTDDPTVITNLIDRAMQDVEARKSSGWRSPPATLQAIQQLASISNTAEFLTTANLSEPMLREKAVNFATAAAPNSDDTRRFAGLIQARVR